MNIIVYSLAILITAVVQTIQGQLDLYHAIIVMQMQLFIHTYGIGRFLLAPRFGPKMKMTVAVQAFELLVIFVPWLLYLWIKDSQFGSQPECNDLVKFVVLFVTVRVAAGWLRRFFLVWSGVIVLAVVILGVVAYLFHRDTKRLEEVHTGPETAGVGSGGCKEDVDQEQLEVVTTRRNSRTIRRNSRMFQKSTDVVLWAVFFICATYVIVATELIVHRNRPHVQAGEDYWGFGQIVSVILILPVVIEILFTFAFQEGEDNFPKQSMSIGQWAMEQVKDWFQRFRALAPPPSLQVDHLEPVQ
ncbi:hypothetical protein EI94DRAFT_818056 [Lactarius quietus]|nr:hypothetical protein EI94DRAFT_818056 [Lactarius quietus]